MKLNVFLHMIGIRYFFVELSATDANFSCRVDPGSCRVGEVGCEFFGCLTVWFSSSGFQHLECEDAVNTCNSVVFGRYMLSCINFRCTNDRVMRARTSQDTQTNTAFRDDR